MYKIIITMIILLSVTKIHCEWKQVQYEQYEYCESIQCLDKINCFAFTNHPSLDIKEGGYRIYFSKDAGINWETLYTSPWKDTNGEPTIVQISYGKAIKTGHFFIISDDYPIIVKSSDSGKTFKKIVLQENANGTDKKLRAFAMYDENYGFVTNSNNYFTTTDGWETFVSHPKKSSDQRYYSPIFLDSNTIIMTYDDDSIIWNNGKGYAFIKYHLIEDEIEILSYFERDTNAYFDAIRSIYFVNDTLGFACGRRSDTGFTLGQYQDIIYRTTNAGNNWEIILKQLQKPEKGLYNNISFADENNGIAVGFYGKIVMTNDGGKTWVYEPYPNAMKNCRKMLVTWAGHTPLIGTWDAGIFRYEGDFFDFPDDTTDVKEYRNKLLGDIKVSVRYRNNKLYVSIGDEHSRKYDLKISNIFGNIIFSETVKSGSGTMFYPYDLSKLPNGVYLYNISLDDVLIKTGKINIVR